jgi:hypothetical protein
MKTMTRTRIWRLTLILSACAPSLTSAQSKPLPVPGEELRVSWNDPFGTLGGITTHMQSLEIVRVDQHQLVGRRGKTVYVIDSGTLTRLQRRIGTKPATASEMVMGSGVGFALGFLVGAISARANGSSDAMNAGLSTGVLIGAPVGALVTFIASRSRGIYEDVFVPKPLGRGPGHQR